MSYCSALLLPMIIISVVHVHLFWSYFYTCIQRHFYRYFSASWSPNLHFFSVYSSLQTVSNFIWKSLTKIVQWHEHVIFVESSRWYAILLLRMEFSMEIIHIFRSPDSKRDHDDDRRTGKRERRRSPSRSR
jgi:hypothetical protein